MAMSRVFSCKHMWWITWHVIPKRLEPTTSVVTSTYHSRITIHLPFGECSSIRWFLVISFGGMVPYSYLVGQTNFCGCYIMKSHAHWLCWFWTNLTPLELLQWAFDLVPQHASLIVNVNLDTKHISQVQHDDQPPLAIVNNVGQS